MQNFPLFFCTNRCSCSFSAEYCAKFLHKIATNFNKGNIIIKFPGFGFTPQFPSFREKVDAIYLSPRVSFSKKRLNFPILGRLFCPNFCTFLYKREKKDVLSFPESYLCTFFWMKIEWKFERIASFLWGRGGTCDEHHLGQIIPKKEHILCEKQANCCCKKNAIYLFFEEDLIYIIVLFFRTN